MVERLRGRPLKTYAAKSPSGTPIRDLRKRSTTRGFFFYDTPVQDRCKQRITESLHGTPI